MRRQPAVAGHFYPASTDRLKTLVDGFTSPQPEKIQAFGVVSPHAGLVYSGSVAGAVYSRIHIPDTVILIGPNHTGLGTPVSIMTEGTWETPLGSVEVDTVLGRSILSRSGKIKEDSLAHLREHSLEVQLPFLQRFKKDFRIIPIQMLDVRIQTCLDLGRAVAEAIRERVSAQELNVHEPGTEKSGSRNPVLIVASSDMSHYEEAAAAREKDFKAIDRILNLDSEGLHRAVQEHDITMCGFGPAVAMLTACKMLGASRAELVKYANSGDVSGDYDQVVGYAGIIIS